MGTLLKNSYLAVTDRFSSVFTAGLSTCVVIQCQLANVSDTTDATVDIVWLDASEADHDMYLAKNISVPVGVSVSPLIGKLVLEAGDQLQVIANASGLINCTVSVADMNDGGS